MLSESSIPENYYLLILPENVYKYKHKKHMIFNPMPHYVMNLKKVYIPIYYTYIIRI